ncbi:MAG TPA: hypothetical protein VF219_15535 [Vicinamibacterales bacterium]
MATIAPIATREAVSVVDFLCPTRATCGNWAAGSYEFDVTVNGTTKSTRGTKYEFVERGMMRILAVPVTANYGGTIADGLPMEDLRRLHPRHVSRRRRSGGLGDARAV